ncbi:alanine aminotransferas-like protein [Piedraia hortae CBS 480.64]|uniref:Glutamate pyruvate transaminase n=1 Tax=Piedraia hortae CBS 480.64 TaxID=1314780 RepID=A0A6A7BZU3_9PEZI|nr:alanine aminotransferas-like protein [Piedraia hortae CBS 480.64]
MADKKPAFTIDKVNPHVVEAKYAVRGELAVKSEQYRSMLEKGEGKNLPFDTVISANIGNPQQLDQKPITFFRQVLSILENPDLLQAPDKLEQFFGYKPDVVTRAQELLKAVKSVGAYSQSQGAPLIRQSVANFIGKRDGYPADASSIFLCGGASSGVNTLLNCICSGPKTGILVPIPQYPLYTATLSLLNAQMVPYYLNEENNWSTSVDDMKKALQKARSDGIDVRAVVVINPGNPTGGSLSEADIQSVVKLATHEGLIIMADEVYQTNIFAGQFSSFKKVLRKMQSDSPREYASTQLASLHSVSKGMIGECGHRGGYFELVGFDEQVTAQIYKFISIMLCPPVIGQCMVEVMVNPPAPGSPSYELYRKEYDGIFNSLHDRANALYKAFEAMEGVSCRVPQGSMYLFPTVKLPQKAIEAAKKEGRAPDEFYCLRLLDATGVCIVPGSGFGQKEGTFHFRTTFLAPGTEWVGRITEFHKKFMDEFR